MKKILILLGLITSLAASGQALAASTQETEFSTEASFTPGLNKVLECALMADSTNERKFDSLGYVISSFTLTLQENHAALQLNLADGTQNVIGTDGYQVVGDNLIQVGWDMNEHWAELTYAEDRYSGMVTVEEDFGFAVICSERL